MISIEDCQVGYAAANRIRHYKIASQMKKGQRQPNNCFRIPQNQPQEETLNIFDCDDVERVPQAFLETAKEYDVVGYRIVKSTTMKKDKRKLARKNTESASSRHSKCSSLPTLDRGLVPKESLLERLKRIEEKENKTPEKPSRLVQSRGLLGTFEKSWQHQLKKHGELLKRKSGDSLICLSDAFRGKVETLETLALSKGRLNPRPEQWERTLCDGRSFANNTVQDNQHIGRSSSPVLRTFEHSTLQPSNSTPFIQLIGKSKLREESRWLCRSTYKHFYTDLKFKC